jgi:glycosyltransferase involved in cell wall biosynthesis
VHYPVGLPVLTASSEDRSDLRNELNTPEDATVIIQVSRMEAWKGHILHLDALGLLREVPNWICWQVGGCQRPHEAQYLEQLKSATRRLGISGRVRFLGQRSDVPRLLAAADVHCQPNIGPEPFGITFIEALFSRLPVVTTALGGACEIVDESCGILVSPGHAGELASTLKQLIQDPIHRQKLGAGGPARALKLCNPATQLPWLNEVLSETTCLEKGR